MTRVFFKNNVTLVHTQLLIVLLVLIDLMLKLGPGKVVFEFVEFGAAFHRVYFQIDKLKHGGGGRACVGEEEHHQRYADGAVDDGESLAIFCFTRQMSVTFS